MKRRGFLGVSSIGILPMVAAEAADVEPGRTSNDLYELRLYRLPSEEKTAVFDRFLEGAAIPAWNRLGVKPVGVFTRVPEDMGKRKPRHEVYVLLPHRSADSLLTCVAQMMQDSEFLAAASELHGAPQKNPAYKRVESSLLLAFDAVPKLELPAKGPDRVFQMRIYESHTEKAAQKKIEMFGRAGEIALFRECGLTPVFFGQTIAGPRMPNLTYMLGFANDGAREKAWETFKGHPGWEKLRSDPQFKDTVSNITNMVLKPKPFSQI